MMKYMCVHCGVLQECWLTKVGSGVYNVILICILNMHFCFYWLCFLFYDFNSIWMAIDESFLCCIQIEICLKPTSWFPWIFFPPHAYVCRGNHKHSQNNCSFWSLNNIVSGFINLASFSHEQNLHSEWSYTNPLVLCN
jgi:hypothetical protein